MVGLVIVSHSRALAEAVAVLVRGVGEVDIPIACAGGAGVAHRELGTDATDIMDAIRRVDAPDGVVVLMDLGSAILSAETALELLESTLQGAVRLLPVALVEGAVAAAVQIGLGADLATVAAEAMEALAPKLRQLGVGPTDAGGSPPNEPVPTASSDASWVARKFSVLTAHGLHARPAARLVRLVGRFEARGEIRHCERDSGWVNAASLNRITLLQVLSGDEFEIRFAGADAEKALHAVAQLVAANFGEPRPHEQDTPPKHAPIDALASYGATPGDDRFLGTPAAPGLAVGPLIVLGMSRPLFTTWDEAGPPLRDTPLDENSVYDGLSCVREAIDLIVNELRRASRAAEEMGRRESAEIGDTHVLLLEDTDLYRSVSRVYAERQLSPPEAFWHAAETIASEYQSLGDPYLRARAVDLLDVATRIVEYLVPSQVQLPQLPDFPAVVIAEDLLPSRTMQLQDSGVVGVVTTQGTANSHAAIIARGLGIPMVTGVSIPESLLSDAVGRKIVVDGDQGTVEMRPDQTRVKRVTRERDRRQAAMERMRRETREPGRLSDGSFFPVHVNVATQADARRAAADGAEGIGLLRTEFLFLGAAGVPGEEAQYIGLSGLIEPFGTRPVTVRLLDIGGDKFVPALNLPREKNPYLGLRGVRLFLDPAFDEVAQSHVRAVLRAGAGRSMQIMVPMVALVEEIRAVRAHLQRAREALQRENVQHLWPVDLGIMVETPAAAFTAQRLAGLVDFFSIGSNDLTQYVMAAERGNGAVAAIADGLHPAVLRAIAGIVEGAHAAGIPVSVCGELGADPAAVPILVGLGIQKLSVNAAALAPVKAQLRSLSRWECGNRAQKALMVDVAGANRGNLDVP